MELQKVSPQFSSTLETKSLTDTLLILKKSSSSSQRDCIQFDFQGSCKIQGYQNWSVSQFLPVYNNDGKFYTPTFVLKMDKEKYAIRDKIYRSLHQERIQSNLEEQTSVLRLPKPFKFNSYCIVCKKQFHDYQKHIQSKNHMEKMLKSQFCGDIDHLCECFGNSSDPCFKKKQTAEKMKRIRKMAKKGKMIQNVETKCQMESIS